MIEIPEARDSERALLGAILIDPTVMDKIGLGPQLFYDVGHQILYSTMRSIGSRELDIVVLTEMLERKGKMDEIGGQAYLLSLISECPQTYNFETYERVIQDTAVRRRVISLCQDLAKDAFNENKPIHEAISQAVSELVNSARSKGGAAHISEFLKRLSFEVEERADNPKDFYGLETGIADFDKITHGLQRGEEFILAGQPGTGKSLLAFQMACGMADRGHAGAIYSLEMSGVAMVRRRLSAVSGISTYNLRSGVGMNERWEDYLKAVEQMDRLPIYISDASDWTTIQMRADLSRLKTQYDVEWFVVDYHDLLGDNVGKDGIEKSAHLSQQLHNICKDLDLAGLVIQSLTKEGYSNPSMRTLSGSTKVMHTADQIAIMIKDQTNPNLIYLKWDKIREGDGGDLGITLIKQSGFPAFQNYKPEEEGYRDYTR